MTQHDLGRTIDARRHDGDACTGRGVADHAVMIESAVPHRTRQDAIERDRNAAGQADLAAMGVDENAKTNYYRMLLQGVAKLDVVSVSPARHFVMFDQPEKFAAALDGALAKVVELSE